MRAIRFRCPGCRTHHTASIARAGQPIACSACFQPMTIPEAAENPSLEIVTARSIEIAPTTTPSPEPEPVVVVEAASETSARPRRKPKPKPLPRPEPPSTFEFEIPIVAEPEIVAEPAKAPSSSRRISKPQGAAFTLVAAVAVSGLLVFAQVKENPGGSAGYPAPAPTTLAIAELAQAVAVVVAPEAMPAPTPAPAPAPAPVEPPRVEPPAQPPIATVSAPPIRLSTPTQPPATAPPLVIRRRQRLGQEELRRQLSELPEIHISHDTETAVMASHGLQPIAHRSHTGHRANLGNAGFLNPVLGLPAGRSQRSQTPESEAGADMHVAHPGDDTSRNIALLKRKQPELAQLPWRMGQDCHLDHEPAEELAVQSKSLRNQLQLAIPVGDTRPDADSLREAFFSTNPTAGSTRSQLARGRSARSDVPAAIPALMQLLMAERTPVRVVLVEILARINGPAASKALARLAMVDLSPEVRERALNALRDRPTAEYRASLVEGLRYPWPPVADHAAEAIATLEIRETIPELVALLDEPDPVLARTEIRDGHPVSLVRSVVQINHLRNCLLCHAPSTSTDSDLVRGRIPTEGMPLPPPQAYYADRSPGEFVKAETTYLRQDFSVTQPVENAHPWPAFQRYDYVVAERLVSAAHPRHRADHKAKPKAVEPDPTPYPQRESTLFALRELTGKDLGKDSAAWKAEVKEKDPGK